MDAFALNTHFQAGFQIKQVVRYLPQCGKVLGAVVFLDPALDLTERYIHTPLQGVFNAPVGTRAHK